MKKMLWVTVVCMLVVIAVCAEADEVITLNPKCTRLPFAASHWVTQDLNGDLLMLDGVGVSKSVDGGKSWSSPVVAKLPEGTALFRGAAGSVLLPTKQGSLILIYMDSASQKWNWNRDLMKPNPGTRLDVWACRSTDGGKTWADCHRVVDGYCGAIIDIKQLSTGEIVAVMQDLMMDEGRHYLYSIVSSDDGKTWKRGNNIDLGGRGCHDGALEPTFVEMKDGRVMMYIRTNLDYFWAAYSDTKGLYWRTVEPSSVKASSSPGHLLRLASGRIALVYNQACADGTTEIIRGMPPQTFAETIPSWFRKELSITFSEDEGKTWSKPQVIASTSKLKEICYPFILERAPGEIWVVIRIAGGHHACFSLRENDFVK